MQTVWVLNYCNPSGTHEYNVILNETPATEDIKEWQLPDYNYRGCVECNTKLIINSAKNKKGG